MIATSCPCLWIFFHILSASITAPAGQLHGALPWSTWRYTNDPSRDELRIAAGDNVSAAVHEFCGRHGMTRRGTNGFKQCAMVQEQVLANYPVLRGSSGAASLPLSTISARVPLIVDACVFLAIKVDDSTIRIVFDARNRRVGEPGGQRDSMPREAARVCAARSITLPECRRLLMGLDELKARRQRQYRASLAEHANFAVPGCRAAMFRREVDRLLLRPGKQRHHHFGRFVALDAIQDNELLSSVHCGDGLDTPIKASASGATTVPVDGPAAPRNCRLRNLFFFQGRWFFIVPDPDNTVPGTAGEADDRMLRGRARASGRARLRDLRRRGLLSVISQHQGSKGDIHSADTRVGTDGTCTGTCVNSMAAGGMAAHHDAMHPAVATVGELRACMQVAAVSTGTGTDQAVITTDVARRCDDATGVLRGLAQRVLTAQMWQELLPGHPDETLDRDIARVEQASARRLQVALNQSAVWGQDSASAAGFLAVQRPHVMLKRADGYSHGHMLFDGAVPVFAAMMATTGKGSVTNSTDLRDVQIVLVDGKGHLPFDDRLQIASRWAPVYADEAHLRLCPFGSWCRFDLVLTIDRTLGSMHRCDAAQTAHRTAIYRAIRSHMLSTTGTATMTVAADTSAESNPSAASGHGLLLERETWVALSTSDKHRGKQCTVTSVHAGFMITIVQRSNNRIFRRLTALVQGLISLAQRARGGILPDRLRAKWTATACLRFVVRVVQMEQLALAEQVELLRSPWAWQRGQLSGTNRRVPMMHAHAFVAMEGTALDNLLFAPPGLLVIVVGRDPTVPYPAGCLNTETGKAGEKFPHKCVLGPMLEHALHATHDPSRAPKMHVDFIEANAGSGYEMPADKLGTAIRGLLQTAVTNGGAICTTSPADGMCQGRQPTTTEILSFKITLPRNGSHLKTRIVHVRSRINTHEPLGVFFEQHHASVVCYAVWGASLSVWHSLGCQSALEEEHVMPMLSSGWHTLRASFITAGNETLARHAAQFLIDA